MSPYRFFDGSGPKFFCRVNGLLITASWYSQAHSASFNTLEVLKYLQSLVRTWKLLTFFPESLRKKEICSLILKKGEKKKHE